MMLFSKDKHIIIKMVKFSVRHVYFAFLEGVSSSIGKYSTLESKNSNSAATVTTLSLIIFS